MVMVFTASSSPSPCPPLFLSEPAPEAINTQLELNYDCNSTFPFYLPRAGFFSRAGRGAGILLLSSHVPRAGRTETTGQHQVQEEKERFVFCMFYVVAASVPIRNLRTHFTATSWSRSVLSVGPAPGHGQLWEGLGPWATRPCPDRTKEGGWQARGMEACPEDTRGGTCHSQRGLLSPMSYQPLDDAGRSAAGHPSSRVGKPLPRLTSCLACGHWKGQGWSSGVLTHSPPPPWGSSP